MKISANYKLALLTQSVELSRARSPKLSGPGFKSRPGTVGGPVTIIMWDAQQA